MRIPIAGQLPDDARAGNAPMIPWSTFCSCKSSPDSVFGAQSQKADPDPNLNHRCSSSRRTNCKRRDSRSQNRLVPTNLAVRYCRTQQYSVTALTDSNAAIKERYAYDGYGNLSIFDGSGSARTSTSEGNRYTYTGREWDEELEHFHYRARMYDPLAGRFLSRDPIGFEGMSMSLYRYVEAILRRSPILLVSHLRFWEAHCHGAHFPIGQPLPPILQRPMDLSL